MKQPQQLAVANVLTQKYRGMRQYKAGAWEQSCTVALAPLPSHTRRQAGPHTPGGADQRHCMLLSNPSHACVKLVARARRTKQGVAPCYPLPQAWKTGARTCKKHKPIRRCCTSCCTLLNQPAHGPGPSHTTEPHGMCGKKNVASTTQTVPTVLRVQVTLTKTTCQVRQRLRCEQKGGWQKRQHQQRSTNCKPMHQPAIAHAPSSCRGVCK